MVKLVGRLMDAVLSCSAFKPPFPEMFQSKSWSRSISLAFPSSAAKGEAKCCARSCLTVHMFVVALLPAENGCQILPGFPFIFFAMSCRDLLTAW